MSSGLLAVSIGLGCCMAGCGSCFSSCVADIWVTGTETSHASGLPVEQGRIVVLSGSLPSYNQQERTLRRTKADKNASIK